MKTGIATVGWFIIFVLMIVFAVGMFRLLQKTNVPTENIYFSACGGSVEGEVYRDTVTGVILGYGSARCTQFTNKGTCELAFQKRDVGGTQKTACVWFETTLLKKGDSQDVFTGCLLALSCEQLSVVVEPKCTEVPRCKPVAPIKSSLASIFRGFDIRTQVEERLGG